MTHLLDNPFFVMWVVGRNASNPGIFYGGMNVWFETLRW